jgi:hypothetical protein
MRVLDYFGGDVPLPVESLDGATVERVIERRLNRILAFCGLSIHDVVNNSIAKNQVLGYYKLSRTVDRGNEIIELERQWNSLGKR